MVNGFIINFNFFFPLSHGFLFLFLIETVFFYTFQLCDVSLRVGNSVTKAHRLVLASSSPYFYAMFNGECRENVAKPRFLAYFKFLIFRPSPLLDDMAEKLQSEVELHDVDIGALQLLVEYSYTGQVHITDENVQVNICISFQNFLTSYAYARGVVSYDFCLLLFSLVTNCAYAGGLGYSFGWVSVLKVVIV